MNHGSCSMLAHTASTRLTGQKRWFILFCLAAVLCTQPSNAGFPESGHAVDSSRVISGVVRDDRGPIAGATVRLQTTPHFTVTDSAGSFELTVPNGRGTIVLTAWAPGHYIGGGIERQTGEHRVEFKLERHCYEDHRDYRWVSAFSSIDKEQACQNCHEEPGNPDSNLPLDGWRKDAHARSATNIRFLTMYLGTDVDGNQSPPTRYHGNRDYNPVPARPNPNRPYYGPGYKLDFPTTNGNCAACHAPMAAIDTPYGIDPSLLTGVEAEGIGCDFCHKIVDVTLDPRSGVPYDNRPGVISFVFRRPEQGHQLFAGPFDDVAPGEDVYSPVQRESRYCAPCHSARFWDVEIYNSYGEWLASPYARAESQTTCQDCHMPPGLNDHFARVDKGGKQRDPESIFDHRMPGAADTDLLRSAVSMTVGAELGDDALQVRIEIRNDRTGHHVPTDSPLRQMILIVRATDGRGGELALREGPTLPDWCGVGNPDAGYVAGLPGTAYAKILKELWTGVSPTGAYWNQTRIVSDNRIAAMDSDETTYVFEPPAEGSATLDVRLLYRRAFIELRDLKGWEGEDIEMARRTMVVERLDGPAADPAWSALKGHGQ